MKNLRETRLYQWILVGAFMVIWLVWGSTFLAGRIAVRTVPPILLAALRSLAAGALLFAVLRLAGNRERVPWRPAFLAGVLFFLGGHGGLAAGLRTVPSGAAALVEGTTPLWIVLFGWWSGDSRRPSGREIAGVAIGLLGVVVLSAPWEFVRGGALDPRGTVLLLVSSISWAAGSIYVRRNAVLSLPGLPTAAMLLTGGGMALVLSLALGEAGRITPGTFSPASVTALAYLVAFGSLLGSVAYTWLLGETSAAKVSSYAYVNPVIAVLLGGWLAGEELSGRTLLAALITIAGVVLVVAPRRVREPLSPCVPLQPEIQGAST